MAQKRFLASVHGAKTLRKTLSKTVADRERSRLEQYKLAEQEKLSKGLAGQRLGRHIVPEGDVDVQLGEDLSESFRQMKVRIVNSFLANARSSEIVSRKVICSKIASLACNSGPLSSPACLFCTYFY